MIHDRKTIAKLRRLRRGGVYVAVIGVAMIVSIVSLSAMQITRLQLKSALAAEEMAEARLIAQSAVERAMMKITEIPTWRSVYTSGTLYPTDWLALGSGDLKFALIDSDGDLNDDQNDAVTVKGIGRSGDAAQVATVMLEPAGGPLDCLEVSLCVNGNLEPQLPGTMTTHQIISSNGNTEVGSGANITGDVEAVGNISGSITGSETTGISLREMPHEHVFDYYLFNGTWIDVDSLPVDGSKNPLISSVLMTPTANPFGAKNPSGIYVIDCLGKDLRIEDCRIVGTIVLLNPGPSAALADSVVLEPAAPNFPSLLVQGDISLLTSDIDLSEAAIGVNLNPVGTPYRNVEDSDQSDTYPSVVRGLVYVSGTLSIPADGEHSRFRGVVVCEEILASSAVTFKYDPVFFNYPPPGFSQGPEWRIMPGSWQRSSN